MDVLVTVFHIFFKVLVQGSAENQDILSLVIISHNLVTCMLEQIVIKQEELGACLYLG